MKIFLPINFSGMPISLLWSSFLRVRFAAIGLIATLSLCAPVAFSQSVSGPSSACAGEPVNFYFIPGCAGSYVSQGGWRFNPEPDETNFFVTAGGYTSVSVKWHTDNFGSVPKSIVVTV